MGFNSKEIKTISTAKGKGDPLKGTIYDPMGQWKYPGHVTKVPGHDITMEGVDYPVLGVDNLGTSQIMMPGNNYSYPGQTVTEYPLMGRGGSSTPGPGLTKEKAKAFLEAGAIYGHPLTLAQDNKFRALLGIEEDEDLEDFDFGYSELDEERRGGAIRRLPRGYTSKNIQSSINFLMARNHTLFGPPGKHYYHPNAQLGGGIYPKVDLANDNMTITPLASYKNFDAGVAFTRNIHNPTGTWLDAYVGHPIGKKGYLSMGMPLNYKEKPTVSYDREFGDGHNIGLDIIPSTDPYIGLRYTKTFKDGGNWLDKY
jgi:hypothetical protein